MLKELGFDSEVYAEHIDPPLSGQIRRLQDLRVEASDILLIHHSMGHDALAHLADLRCRRFLVYHNITPPEFFAEATRTGRTALKGIIS